MDKLLELYKAILTSLNIEADKDGLLTYRHDDVTVPVTVKEKRLVIPTQPLLKMGLGDNLMAFHPLSESVVRGESPVLRRLKAAVNFRLSLVIGDLLQQLLEVGVQTDRHSKISPKASKYLMRISEVDTKSASALEKILSKTSQDGDNRLISVYLKRGGKLHGGTKFSRTAMVSFPFHEEFEGETATVFGVKVRKKDFHAFKALFEYILPEPDSLDTYSAGSNSLTAPYFCALMNAYLKVAKRLNEVVKLHKKELDNDKDLLTDVSWEDSFASCTDYRDLIPPLPGNQGDEASEPSQTGTQVRTDTGQPATTSQGTKSFFTPAEAPKPQPTQPAVERTSHGVNFGSILHRSQQPQYPQPPAPVAAPPQQGYYRGMPVQQSPQAGWGQQPGVAPMPPWLAGGNPGNQVVMGGTPPQTNWGAPQGQWGSQPNWGGGWGNSSV